MNDILTQIRALPAKSINMILIKYHKLPKELVAHGNWKTGVKLAESVDSELGRVSANDFYGAINLVSPTGEIDMANMSAEVRDLLHTELRAVLSDSKGMCFQGDKVLNLFPDIGDDEVIRNAGFIPVNIN